jgi:hypothetical protein
MQEEVAMLVRMHCLHLSSLRNPRYVLDNSIAGHSTVAAAAAKIDTNVDATKNTTACVCCCSVWPEATKKEEDD